MDTKTTEEVEQDVLLTHKSHQTRKAVFFSYIKLVCYNENYRLLWLGDVVSLLGDWFNLIATLETLDSITSSGTFLSFLMLARFLPPVLLTPVVGIVADRFDRRIILLISNVGRTATVLCFLMVRSAKDLWLLYLLVVTQASLAAFFEPTRASLMPSLVHEQDLLTANSLDGITWSVMTAVGSGLGGLLLASFGSAANYVVDAVSFVLSAALLYRLMRKMQLNPSPPRPVDAPPDIPLTPQHDSTTLLLPPSPPSRTLSVPSPRLGARSPRQHNHVPVTVVPPDLDDHSPHAQQPSDKAARPAMMAEWRAFLCRHPNVLLLCCVKFALATVYGGDDTLSIKAAETYLAIRNDVPVTLGCYYISIGVGALAGIMFANHVAHTDPLVTSSVKIRGQLRVVLWSVVLHPIPVFLVGYASHLPLMMLANFMRCAFAGAGWSFSSNVLQLMTPDAMRGRVFSLDMALATIGEASSSLATGLAFDYLSFTPHTAAYALATWGVAIGLVFAAALRRLLVSYVPT